MHQKTLHIYFLLPFLKNVLQKMHLQVFSQKESKPYSARGDVTRTNGNMSKI